MAVSWMNYWMFDHRENISVIGVASIWRYLPMCCCFDLVLGLAVSLSRSTTSKLKALPISKFVLRCKPLRFEFGALTDIVLGFWYLTCGGERG